MDGGNPSPSGESHWAIEAPPIPDLRGPCDQRSRAPEPVADLLRMRSRLPVDPAGR
jgi:hypothetical protein